MILSDAIRRAIEEDREITFPTMVIGELGAGKTSFAMWTAYNVYGNWESVLDHLVFDPTEALGILKIAHSTRKRVPVLIMDDAGTWLLRSTWWEEPKVAFTELFALIRSLAFSIIFTTPYEELPKQIVNKVKIRVMVEQVKPDSVPAGIRRELSRVCEEYGLPEYYSRARIYVRKPTIMFKDFLKKQVTTYYPTYYPREVYEAYREKRHAAIGVLLKKMEEALHTKADTLLCKILSKARITRNGSMVRIRFDGQVSASLFKRAAKACFVDRF